MKARVCKEKVLLYHLEAGDEKGNRIQRLLKELRIETVKLDETALNETLGALAGLPGYPRTETAAPESVPEQDLMVFCGFSDSRLNAFLRAYREAMIPPVALKAVVTPYNREWRLIDLFRELQQEHAFFQKYQELQRLETVAKLQAVSGERAELLAGLVEKARAFRLHEKPDLAELDRLVLALRKAIE